MKRRQNAGRRPQALRRALSLVAAFAVCGLATGSGCDGSGGHLPVTDTYLFSGDVPATSPSSDPQFAYSASFKDYANIADAPGELYLRRVRIYSNVDLSFATNIEVEAQDWTFYQGRYRTIARFTGQLPIETYAIDLPLYESDLLDYQEPFTGDVNLKVWVQGDAPGVPVHLDGDLDVYQG